MLLILILFLLACFVIAFIISVPTAIGLAIYRGRAVGAKQLNVYKDVVVCEVQYQRGKPQVRKVKFNSAEYRNLAPFLADE